MIWVIIFLVCIVIVSATLLAVGIVEERKRMKRRLTLDLELMSEIINKRKEKL